MTNWLPKLDAASSLPLYRKIADALEGDIARGELAVGARLPTHRDLAWRLSVTVGTVSRAYAEAERRGLIGGEIGRGTFVLPERHELVAIPEPVDANGFVDLSTNYAMTGSEGRLLADALSAFANRRDLDRYLRYQSHAGGEEDRRAGAEWLRRSGLAEAQADHVYVTSGGQHGIAILLAALTRPGDAVAVECLTYPGFKAAAEQFGVQLTGVAMDEHGLRPDALDAVCRARTIRALYTMPTLQNPTTICMPDGRRREIAEVCRRHDLAVIEDDVYGFLRDPPLAALTSYIPDSGFYLSSTSKAFAPGLRVGYVQAPPSAGKRIIAGLRATTYMAAPFMVAIATQWICDGTGDRLATEKRCVHAMRYPIAQRAFAAPELGCELRSSPGSLHCWLIMPPGWRGDEFAASAQRNRVGITPGGAFAVTSGAPEAVRICLGTAPTNTILDESLRKLADLLTAPGSDYLSVV